MNRRSFLKLLTGAAAATVAGLRLRPESTEVVTKLGRGSVLRLDDPAITAEDIQQHIECLLNWRPRVPEPVGIISPTILERYYQLAESGLDRKQAYMQAVMEEGERRMEPVPCA
jgi:hypothetical protein